MPPKKGVDNPSNVHRDSLIQSLERIQTLLDEKGNTLTAIELEIRLGLVESTFMKLNDIQAEIEKLGEDGDREQREMFEELYCKLKAKILTFIAASQQPVINLDSTHNASALGLLNSSASGRSLNLPKLKIPYYSGKYTDWTNWYNTFVTLVHNDNELDNLSKFVHLRNSLGPIPLRTIESIELTPNNYRHAISILKERFEHKSIIVQAHVKELFELPRVLKQNASSLRELIDKVNAHLRALESFGSSDEIAKVIIYHLICTKIDSDTLRRWEDNGISDELPSWNVLSKFLANRCTSLENRDMNVASSSEKNPKRNSSVVLSANIGAQACVFCKRPHSVVDCQKWLRLSPKKRYKEIKKASVCILCLSASHPTRECAAPHCQECQGFHHSKLHRVTKTVKTEPVAQIASSSIKEAVVNLAENSAAPAVNSGDIKAFNSLVMSNSINFLATAVLYARDAKGKLIECRAILDAGSQANFVSQNLAKKLKLDIQSEETIINGIGDAKVSTAGKVSTFIQSRITNFSSRLQFLVMPSITVYAPNVAVDIFEKKLPKNIELADPKFNHSRVIDMLLGVSTFFKILSVGQISLGENLPILQKSLLGWLIAGEYNRDRQVSSLLSHKSESKNDQSLDEYIEKFWECEEVTSSASTLSLEEQFCEEHFVKNVKRTLSGRFIVKLPFKPDTNGVGESYSIAVKRFKGLEKRLNQNESLKVDYCNFIKEYQELDHLEIASPSEFSQFKYIMPHHAVVRPESASTKLRVVFDASCKSSNGFSLNDNLCVGPKIQPDLFDILIRFRCYRFALTADISKMYRQILVQEEDFNWQCILWRNDESKNLEILRLKTVTYGTSSAPYLAVRCLKYLAEYYQEQFPIASQVLLNNFYMDDMLAGANSEEEIFQLKEEVSNLLALGRFELHKWRTTLNDSSLENEFEQTPLCMETNDCAKTLGVFWHSSSDTLKFAHATQFSDQISKRIILSELAQLFDPLGLLNPIIVLGKLIMQELWRLKLQWDESVPQDLHEKWQKYREQLSLVSEISCPRYIANIFAAATVELHGFCDASTRAYGGAVYLRAIDKFGNVSINLLSAKSRIAPLKPLSLPKLELQGAVLLAKLVNRVQSCIPRQVNSVFYWTDSMIVLNWLASHPSRWPTFEANRVTLIQDLTKISSWRKIDSKLNPADIVSRGCWPQDLKENKLWFQGPPFLLSGTAEWPVQKLTLSDNEKLNLKERKNYVGLLSRAVLSTDLISNCKFANDFLKLNRVFAVILRWVNNTKLKLLGEEKIPYTLPLKVSELRRGLKSIIFNVQQNSFANEISALNSKALIKSSKLQKLNPFIDDSDNIPILRVGGRLSSSNLQFKTKHPVILPKDHAFTRALIVYLHKINLHVGAQSLLAFVRQGYWIINGRAKVQAVVRNCTRCFKFRPKAVEQLMGDLPKDRVIGKIYPFEKSGVDFAGPIMIHYKLRGKRPVKAYIALFICFVTKACHLEVVSDLSTPAFLLALKRFVARRGLSSDIYCDNGTNFRGAARELRQLMEHVYSRPASTQIQEECTSRGMNFHFIPPHSPHMGGLWESSIKVAKGMLLKQVNSASLTFEELSTVTAEIEAIMNSRPLCIMSSDPNDLDALTPGHFLVGRPLNCIPEAISEQELLVPPVNRWKRIQHIKELFWRRWTREYLLALQERQKWRKTMTNVDIGTLVLIADDNLPCQSWLLGRIESITRGNDDLVRVVTVKTKSGILKRNVHKICPLPMDYN